MSRAALPAAPASPATIGPRYWLAALAIVPVLATVYQTLVLADVTDDVIRKGIQGDPYDKVWVSLTWGAAILYGVFLGVWGIARYCQRGTVSVGLVLIAPGNLL